MGTLYSDTLILDAKIKVYGKLYIRKKKLNFFEKYFNYSLAAFFIFKTILINVRRKIYRAYEIILFRRLYIHNHINFKVILNDQQIKKISKDLRSNNFVYVENFLSEDSWKYLTNAWPNINHFNLIKKITKYYSAEFSCRDQKSLENIFKKYPNTFGLRKFYEFLFSDKFSIFYKKLVSFEKNNYELCSILSTMAPNKSHLLPHVDGISKKSNIENPYNFLYFIDGYDKNPSQGGATGIYKDNEFKHPIPVPKSLKNTLLIYNSSTDFFHGFQTIKCPNDIFRKTVNFQLLPKNILKS